MQEKRRLQGIRKALFIIKIIYIILFVVYTLFNVFLLITSGLEANANPDNNLGLGLVYAVFIIAIGSIAYSVFLVAGIVGLILSIVNKKPQRSKSDIITYIVFTILPIVTQFVFILVGVMTKIITL